MTAQPAPNKPIRFLMLAFVAIALSITAWHYYRKPSPKASILLPTDSVVVLEKQVVQSQTKIDSINAIINQVPAVRSDSARRVFWQ